MRKTIWASMVALAAFTVGSEARAQANLHTGDVLRPGDNMLYSEVGWPELVLGFQHGVSDRLDVGFRFSFIYGGDYQPFVQLGLGMRVPIRYTPVKRDKFSFQIHFDPGVKFDAFNGEGICGAGTNNCDYNGGLAFGLWIPFGLNFGIHLTHEATLSFGMEAPIYVNFTNGTYGAIPLLFGPGFEYHIDEHISLGVDVKIGPSIIAWSRTYGENTYSYSATNVGFITTGFFAYRL